MTLLPLNLPQNELLKDLSLRYTPEPGALFYVCNKLIISDLTLFFSNAFIVNFRYLSGLKKALTSYLQHCRSGGEFIILRLINRGGIFHLSKNICAVGVEFIDLNCFLRGESGGFFYYCDSRLKVKVFNETFECFYKRNVFICFWKMFLLQSFKSSPDDL